MAVASQSAKRSALREYQGEKESLYRVALALVNEKIAFMPSPFLNLSSDIGRDGATDTISAGGWLGVTQMLRRGGSVVLTPAATSSGHLQPHVGVDRVVPRPARDAPAPPRRGRGRRAREPQAGGP